MNVATAEAPEWREMTIAPLTGTKCLLLTEGGVAVVGTVPLNINGYRAWSPLPKLPTWLKG